MARARVGLYFPEHPAEMAMPPPTTDNRHLALAAVPMRQEPGMHIASFETGAWASLLPLNKEWTGAKGREAGPRLL